MRKNDMQLFDRVVREIMQDVYHTGCTQEQKVRLITEVMTQFAYLDFTCSKYWDNTEFGMAYQEFMNLTLDKETSM